MIDSVLLLPTYVLRCNSKQHSSVTPYLLVECDVTQLQSLTLTDRSETKTGSTPNKHSDLTCDQLQMG